MRKITSFLLALLLFAGTVTGLHIFVDRHLHFDAGAFGCLIDQRKFFAGQVLAKNMSRDSLLVLGSSEFRHGRSMSSHPARLFRGTGVEIMMVGAGYYQSLFHAIELAALADSLARKKVVLILSPQWFTAEGVLAPGFASRFPEENFLAAMDNDRVSADTRTYMMKRSKALLRGDPQTLKRVKLYEHVYLRGDASFVQRQYTAVYRAFLEEKSRISVFAAARAKGISGKPAESAKTAKSAKSAKTQERRTGLDRERQKRGDRGGMDTVQAQATRPIEKRAISSGKSEPDWQQYEWLAEAEGKAAAGSNPFYVSDRIYQKKIRPIMKQQRDSAGDATYAASPEYDDLACFLQVCRDTGIEPLLVMMPVNGYWYDYIGFPKAGRQDYYARIRRLAGEYGVQVADLSGGEYTRYFFLDKVHLGWKGWLQADEEIYRFVQEDNSR